MARARGSQKVTSKPVAQEAAKQLPKSQTPRKYRAPIASALAQAPGKRRTAKKRT